MPFRADLKGPFVRSANYLYPTTTGSLRIRYRFYLPLNGFAIKFVLIIGAQNRLVKSFFQIFSIGTKCLSSRTRSVFHRAGDLPYSVARWTREDTKCLSSRTRSVFHRAGDLPYSVVRWTREDTFPVPQLCLAMPKASPAL